jgi:hypothetical protein
MDISPRYKTFISDISFMLSITCSVRVNGDHLRHVCPSRLIVRVRTHCKRNEAQQEDTVMRVQRGCSPCWEVASSSRLSYLLTSFPTLSGHRDQDGWRGVSDTYLVSSYMIRSDDSFSCMHCLVYFHIGSDQPAT